MQFIIFPHNRKDLEEIKRIARELNVDRLTIIDTHERAAKVKGENRPKKPEPCQALWLFACVNWNGTVVPCCDSVETPFGDLRQDSFSDVWNGPAYVKSRGLQYGYPYQGPQVEVKCERCRLYNGRPVFEEKLEA
jgi:MoaA/NifB/PqqE/SkfB family radical SAM enzyme